MKNSTDDNAFWLVWNPQGQMPRKRHDTEHSAHMEARRLATLHRGQVFYVLQATDALEVDAVRHTRLLQDVPF
jgi:hypothetical protein